MWRAKKSEIRLKFELSVSHIPDICSDYNLVSYNFTTNDHFAISAVTTMAAVLHNQSNTRIPSIAMADAIDSKVIIDGKF